MSDPSEPTGNPAVDDVLELLGDLDELPVDEHVAVFDTAHEKLRGALDAQPDRHQDGPPVRATNPIPPGLRPGG